MCMGGGGGSSSPPHNTLTDPATGQTYNVEQGVPLDYAIRGASTVAQYQTMASQDTSNQQIAAQKAIADQQAAFNQQQLDYQKQQQDLATQQATDQANRQTAYDTGRAQNLAEGTQQINDAFSQFNDDYFNKYAQDYMSQVGDQVDYQKDLATKQTSFDMARSGLTDSQAHVNQLGLLDETAGRTLADQTAQAQTQANSLRDSITGAKNNLMSQLQASETLSSPIAGNTMDDVNSALQTQKSAISGLGSNANDIVSSTSAVPQVSTLGDIFSGVVGSGGSYLGGVQANTALNRYYAGAGVAAPSPFK